MAKTLNSKTNEGNWCSEKVSSRESIHTGLIKQIILHIYKMYKFAFSSHCSLKNTYIFTNFVIICYNRKIIGTLLVTRA